MEACSYAEICGGCLYRREAPEDYQERKEEAFRRVMAGLKKQPEQYGNPVFIPDGTRRRASLAFRRHKGKLVLGFNMRKSAEIVDIQKCCLLTPQLNAVLPEVRDLLTELCSLPFSEKKGRKIQQTFLTAGDVWLCQADNGIDLVLEFDSELDLSRRMVIFEKAQNSKKIIRISHRRRNNETPEPVVEKFPPLVDIAGVNVYIPAGCFMQASGEAERTLIGLVLKYLGNTEGNIADLFCGMGTFSYPLSRNIRNKITAVDSSAELLNAFAKSIHKNMIPNIEIKNKNLFKYPLDENELKNFTAIVFDPPRAGASAQVAKMAALSPDSRTQKIIAVSCNPESFVNDANVLLEGGYCLKEITMVDQFICSNHMELVALFSKQ